MNKILFVHIRAFMAQKYSIDSFRDGCV